MRTASIDGDFILVMTSGYNFMVAKGRDIYVVKCCQYESKNE